MRDGGSKCNKIKVKNQWDKDHLVSHLGEMKNHKFEECQGSYVKKRGEEKRKRKRKSMNFNMEVWVFMDYFGFCMDFVWKNNNNNNQTINPFLMNLGLKEPYFVY